MIRSWLGGALLLFPIAAQAVEIGQVAPETQGPRLLYDHTIDLKELRGKTVLLDFWASWCGPCRQEMPLMDDLYAQYKDLGFTILAVNVDENRDEAHRFLDKVPVSYPILYDPQSDVSEQYEVQAMPTTVMIDRDGNARFLHHGYQPGYEDEYETQIRQLVRE